MREPTTTAAWQEWDAQQHDEDIRRQAARARTEDEYLEALREAGSLAAGAAVMNYGRPVQLSLTDRIVLAQCRVRESDRLATQAALPPYHGMTPEAKARLQAHEAEVDARLEAFRILGDGPALSEEWRLAKGNYWSPETGYHHDYDAAVAAELAARRSLKETA